MPYTPEKKAAWAKARVAAGLCRNCNDKAIPGESRCEKHKQARRKK